MLRLLSTFCLALCVASLAAQNIDPRAYYSFDDGTANESQGSEAQNAIVSGAPTAACGAVGGSLRFDGVNDYLTIPSPIVNNVFENSDFVVSFWFHPTGVSPRQTLIRKKVDCAQAEKAFSIDYLPALNALEINFSETAGRTLGGATNRVPLNPARCWQHFVVERRGTELQLYLNGVRVARLNGGSRFNIANTSSFEIAHAGCPGTESNFAGFIDELRIYAGSVQRELIEGLYSPVDLIAPLAFPVINAGEEVRLLIPRTCATDFAWTPAASIVEGATTASPLVKPTETTTYFATLSYPQSGCRSRDSVLVQVFDPDNYDCTQLLLPAAFSPNGLGPESNERFGISNAATLQEFTAFEIYDRWGNRVFETADPFGRWDGSYAGEPAMPGIYLWRVAYACNSEDLNRTGSVVLMR